MKQTEMFSDSPKKTITFPVMNVQMIPTEKLRANNYNPNSVAPPEMRLLRLSIEHDGYTQPIVCYYDKEEDAYIIVDGFHRFRCAVEYFDLPAVPVVVIDKPIGDRMASTIRHNRARGKHGIDPMVTLVASLYAEGWGDEKIAKELGMDADEVLRLKQQRGLAEMFADNDYSKSWEVG